MTDKFSKQMMDIINSTPMTTPTPTGFVVLPTQSTSTQKQAAATAETQTQQPLELPVSARNRLTPTPAITDVPMATSPTTHNRRTPLPAAPKRDVADQIAEGSAAKQQRTEQQQTAAQRPKTTQELNVSSDRHNKTWRQSQGSLQRRPTRGSHREDTSWTVGHQHGRLKQGANNRRDETGDQVNESTTSLHRSLFGQPYCRTTQQNHQIKMCPSTEG